VIKYIIVFIGLCSALALFGASPIEVYFAPGSEPIEAIVRELNSAKKTVHLQAYSFTSTDVAKALTDAEKRGVKVVAILDRSNRTKNYSAADFLVHENVETYIDSMHPISHNKIIIIDDSVVLTGSVNFTKASEKNAENLLVIRDADLAKKYEANWQNHFKHSEYYAGK
jgi:phosphatidylserine/phosphatidylglycerophosphate/cardiolipin synthase-like enzyme